MSKRDEQSITFNIFSATKAVDAPGEAQLSPKVLHLYVSQQNFKKFMPKWYVGRKGMLAKKVQKKMGKVFFFILHPILGND